MTQAPNQLDQHALWNGPAGQAWIEEKDVLDRMFQSFEDLLVEHASHQKARAVLDIGCGTGRTTLALAEKLGPQARCVGVDISEPMLAVARERAAEAGLAAQFVAADAQRHAFAPSSFDLFVSRFGVMFFDDPALAFSRLRAAARPGAGMCCIAWRGAAENAFMTTAERAVATMLPSLPPRRPGAPGQFAFAERQHVEAVLGEAGWTRIAVTPLDLACRFPADKLRAYVSRLGPIGAALQSADEAARQRILDVALAAFEPFVHADEVCFDAACWRMEAVA
jgi:SAM-dependent methyltransferase